MTDKPKRPMTAYMLWFNSVREQIKAENPGLKVTEVAVKAGEIWRSMNDKTEWKEMAAKAKEKYAKDLESYNNKGDGTKNKEKKAAPVRYKRNKDESDEEESEDEDEDSD